MPGTDTPLQLFVHRLGGALAMEETNLRMLDKLQQEASDPKLKEDLQQHSRETRQQVENLQRVFEAMGEQAVKRPNPAIEGIEHQGEQLIREVHGSLVDTVVLAAVIETEHHEVAVYDGLIIEAEQMDDDDIVALLQENLEQEEAALDKAVKAAERSAKQLSKQYS
jgi:ferritin-like metal-binding protein YciE